MPSTSEVEEREPDARNQPPPGAAAVPSLRRDAWCIARGSERSDPSGVAKTKFGGRGTRREGSGAEGRQLRRSLRSTIYSRAADFFSVSILSGAEHPTVGCDNPSRASRTAASRRGSPSAATVWLAVGLVASSFFGGGDVADRSGFRFASAAPCVPTSSASSSEEISVSSLAGVDLSSVFDCEGGDFEVYWSGSVTVKEPIRLGNGTSVTIHGDYNNGLLSGDGGGVDSISTATSSTSGAGSEVIAGASFGPIFLVQNASLRLENIALRNATARNTTSLEIINGAGIHAVDSEVSIVSCEFEDMFAEHWGAGIFSNRSHVVILDTVFRRCASGDEPDPGDEGIEGAGGGVAVNFTNLLVDNCVFESCYASKKAGSIQVANGNATVSNSIFRNSRAGSGNKKSEEPIGEGGVFSTNDCANQYGGNNGACVLEDCAFYNSSVGRKGGVAHISAGDIGTLVEFNRCLVMNASSGEAIDDDPQGEGGAFSLSPEATLVVRDTTVIGAVVGKKGAAILLSSSREDSWDAPGGAAVLINSTFQDCEAESSAGGVVYLNAFSALNISGESGSFLGNYCGEGGGVLGATTDTRITIEGGLFSGNRAADNGGVIESVGEVTILGGTFAGNTAGSTGGVWATSDDGASFIVEGGTFRANEAEDRGGVGIIGKEAYVAINGGVFSGNTAGTGGVFAVDENAVFEVTGGRFTNNHAILGGFLYKEGKGKTSCSGATVEGNAALDGGAIYVLDDTTLELECDLIGNTALSGPGIYARDDATLTLRDMILYNNTIPRGSVIFLVESDLETYQVTFHDPVGYSDLSAVQADDDSCYIAEHTAFVGFDGEAVIYTRGDLVLDYCDFSKTTAEILVDGHKDSIVRNAILGDANYRAPAKQASGAGKVPEVEFIINSQVTCDGSTGDSLCSGNATCIDGDLGVYCRCYVRELSQEEVCVGAELGGVDLRVVAHPTTTFYPDLLEGQLNLSLAPSDASVSSSSTAEVSDARNGTEDGLLWKAASSPQVEGLVDWTIFPSSGLLLSGESIILEVVGNASSFFDGRDTVTISIYVLGLQGPGETQAGTSSAIAPSSTSDPSTASWVLLEAQMEVEFFHCEKANFWDTESSCRICADAEDDVVEVDGLNCSSPGASTINLPILHGYWRANATTLRVRECLNAGACIGGSSIESADDYCSAGYRGPYCAVCREGYGRGAGKTCHRCSESVRRGSSFAIAFAGLLTLVLGILLTIFLVGGKPAVRHSMLVVRENYTSIVESSVFSSRHRAGRARLMSSSGSTATVPDWVDVSKSSFFSGIPAHDGRAAEICQVPRRKSMSESGVTHARNSGNNPGGHRRNSLDGGNGQFCEENWEIFNPGEEAPRKDHASVVRDYHSDGSSSYGASPRHVAFIGGNAVGRGWRTGGISPAYGEYTSSPMSSEFPEGGAVGTPGGMGEVSLGPKAFDEGGDGVSGRGKEENKETNSAEKIAHVLSRLPLSKLKVVIVVWQIMGAFAQITQVSFPPLYQRFLETIGLISLDLGWILSASCLTTDITFYGKLLIVTIGPMVLLCFLGITFYLGSRRLAPKLPELHRNSSQLSASAPPAPREPPGLAGNRSGFRGVGHEGIGGPSVSARRPHGAQVEEAGSPMPSGHSPLRVAESLEEAEEAGKQEAVRRLPSEAPAIRAIGRKRPSVSQRLLVGLQGGGGPEEKELWNLFARHTTGTLIILYLVYSQTSMTVFQTFSCAHLEEIDKHYLWADFQIECYTPEHRAYMVYAAVMIAIYPFGIPAAFWFFLNRQRSRINPEVERGSKCRRDKKRVMVKKMQERQNDESVSPTAFLWASYLPHRYFFEVVECMRRLLLTGLLIFMLPDSPEQLAFGCVFAFVSLLIFEMLRPHTDELDVQIYRTGCLVIFFSNFLGLLLEAGVADRMSRSSMVFSVIIILTNVLLTLVVIADAYANLRIMLSRSHLQGNIFGFDIIPEHKLNNIIPVRVDKSRNYLSSSGSQSGRGRQRRGEARDDAPEEIEEAAPAKDGRSRTRPKMTALSASPFR